MWVRIYYEKGGAKETCVTWAANKAECEKLAEELGGVLLNVESYPADKQ